MCFKGVLRTFFFSILFFSFQLLSAQERFTIAGYVRDSLSRETLIGATIQARELGRGVSSNQYGYYALSLPKGTYTLVVSFVGYLPQEKKVDLQSDIVRDLPL